MSESEHSCPNCARGRGAGKRTPDGLIVGWPLVAASALVFLLPLLGALAGTILFNGKNWTQLAGAVAGFVVGGGLAMIVARIFKK